VRVGVLVVAVEVGTSLTSLTALLAGEAAVVDIPELATLDEITRAKKLLYRKAALLSVARVEHENLFARGERWWVEQNLAARIETARGLSEKGIRALDSAESAHKLGLPHYLSEAKRAWTQFHSEMVKIESELAALDCNERLLLGDSHRDAFDFMAENPCNRREELLQNVAHAIQTVEAADEKERTDAETAKNMGIGFLVLVVILAILFFVYDEL